MMRADRLSELGGGIALSAWDGGQRDQRCWSAPGRAGSGLHLVLSQIAPRRWSTTGSRASGSSNTASRKPAKWTGSRSGRFVSSRPSQLRVETHSGPPEDDGCDFDGGEEVSGELVVAGCDAPEVLEGAEGPFDPVALAIGVAVVGDRPLARGGGGDDGLGLLRFQGASQAVGVVSLVGDQPSRRRSGGQKARCGGDVGAVPGCEQQCYGAPASICQGMDFRGRTATRAPDGLNLRPPFPPCAERCARTAVESMLISSASSA